MKFYLPILTLTLALSYYPNPFTILWPTFHISRFESTSLHKLQQVWLYFTFSKCNSIYSSKDKLNMDDKRKERIEKNMSEEQFGLDELLKDSDR